jgi:hypothetical protein
LLNFAKLSAEEFDNKNPRRDSIQQLLPFSIITLVTKGGDTTQVKLHPIVPERYVTQDIETGEFVRAGGGPIERYFADLNGQDSSPSSICSSVKCSGATALSSKTESCSTKTSHL